MYAYKKYSNKNEQLINRFFACLLDILNSEMFLNSGGILFHSLIPENAKDLAPERIFNLGIA